MFANFFLSFPSHDYLISTHTHTHYDSIYGIWLQIMDERWESEIIEYGAINITGFRILDTHKRNVKEFLEGWRKLDATTSPGAGKEHISVGGLLFFIVKERGKKNDRSRNNK